MIKDLILTYQKIRQEKPLILCLTNYVTMDLMANSLLAIGAAPIMTEEEKELEELVLISKVVNINIGTINDALKQRLKTACKLSIKYNKPIILDPVGAGASKIRTQLAINLAQYAEIIRGNASEILALNSSSYKSSGGVESTSAVSDAKFAAFDLARVTNKVYAITGKDDYITNGSEAKTFSFGNQMMQSVTGMGCSLNAIIAAFRAVVNDPFLATAEAILFYTLCGSVAAENSSGPGSYRVNFLDQLYNPDWVRISKIYA